MQKVNSILSHPLFKQNMIKNEHSESQRRFCKHDIAHSMDVARIACIINIEDELGFSKEVIYAAALLHDITKWQQHLEGIPHNESAILPSKNILRSCDFSDEEISVICDAILNHRDSVKNSKEDNAFSHLIFRADKLSRACYFCRNSDDCNWNDERKNALLLY